MKFQNKKEDIMEKARLFFIPCDGKGEPLRQRRGFSCKQTVYHHQDLVFGPFESIDEIAAEIRNIFSPSLPLWILLLKGEVRETATLGEKSPPCREAGPPCREAGPPCREAGPPCREAGQLPEFPAAPRTDDFDGVGSS